MPTTEEAEGGPVTTFHLYLDDAPPDSLGRSRFELCWEDKGACWRTEPSKLDGRPVGYRRAQLFFSAISEHVSRLRRDGHRVVVHRGERSPYEQLRNESKP